jgi:hypothetical protein
MMRVMLYEAAQFHVVGQDVQRHFGTYVLERFHLEVRRSHPRLYRAEGMLHSLDPERTLAGPRLANGP